MSSDVFHRPKMETSVKLQLLGTLEDLGDVELERFQWFLQDQELLDGFQAIKKFKLENANRLRTVDVMVETYTTENVMKVAELVFKKMKEYGGQSWEEKGSNTGQSTKTAVSNIFKNI